MKRLLAAAFFLIAASTLNNDGFSQRPVTNPFDKIRIGVLRASGAIVPFAEYYRNQWWNPWPEKDNEYDESQVKIKSLGNHSHPWFLGCDGIKSPWYSSTAQGRSLILIPSELTEVNNHDGDNWALLTNLENRKKFNPSVNHDDIGFALSANVPIDQMVEVKTDSDEAVWFREQMTTTFANVESEEMDRIAAENGAGKSSWGQIPFSANERTLTKIRIMDLSRSRTNIDGRDVYYVSMQKEYGKSAVPNEFDCGGTIYFLYAWVFKNHKGQIQSFDISSGITDCDGKERSSSVLRFATFKLGDRNFIVTVEHGYEDEQYVIYEVVEFGINKLLETYGGGL